MSWLKRRLGLDAFDLFLQTALTGMVLAVFAVSEARDEVYPMTIMASLIVLGVRRALYLRKEGGRGLTTGEMAAERIAELEQRVAELEASQAQVYELQERLDFAERLLGSAAHAPAAGLQRQPEERR